MNFSHRIVSGAVLALAVLIAHSSPGAAQSSCSADSLVSPAQFFPAGGSPFGIATGDFNGDTIPDFVTSIVSGTSVRVQISPAGANPGYFVDYPAGESPGDVAVADLDQDGHPDLIVADGSLAHSEVSILRGLGGGNFAPRVAYPSGLQVYRVAVGDLNGDGFPDIAATFFGSSQIGVYLNRGDGTFFPYAPYILGSQPYSIAIGDFNSDGLPDLVVGEQGSHDLRILMGTGGGVFLNFGFYSVSGPVYSVRCGDFNEDGVTDLAAIQDGGGIAVLLGNGLAGHGNGTFNPPLDLASGGANLSILLSDYDHDGHLDIGITSPTKSAVDIFRGHGNGTFSAPVSYPVGSYPAGLASADFNRDGLLDLVCADYLSHNAAMLLGKCASFVPPPPPPCPGAPLFSPAMTYHARPKSFGLASGDFNHDGIVDLAVGGNSSNDVMILLGAGGGAFNPGPSYPAGFAPVDVTAADLNLDGILDLVVVNGVQGANSVSVLLGNGSGGIGDGTFGLPRSYPAGNKPYRVVVRDFDGDGRADLVTTEFDGNAVSFLKANGDGSFQAPHSYPAGLAAYGIVAADFNSDGYLDLAVGNQNSHDVSILFGNGHGTFSPPAAYNAGGPVYSLAVGDFNHDGILDLAVVDGGTSRIGVFPGGGTPGHGDGTFGPEVRYMVSGVGPAGIAAADFNHDGILDLAVSNASSSMLDVLIGLEEGGVGDGKFSAPFSFPMDSYPFALQIGDFDRDGVLTAIFIRVFLTLELSA